jgi:hypothetical protein
VTNGFNVDVFISEREEYKTNLLIIQDQLRKVGVQINLRLLSIMRAIMSIFAATSIRWWSTALASHR